MDTTPADIVSAKTEWGSHLYLIVRSSIGKRHAKDGCKHVLTPLWVVCLTVQGLSLVNISPLRQGLRIDLFTFRGLDIAEARRRVKAGQVVSDQ